MVHHQSGRMQGRFGLSTALTNRPDIIILDDPTVAKDIQTG